MLDFRMETFLTVCQCMNFTRASEKLNITQPAVSQHIHFLEKHYNTKLFRYERKEAEAYRSRRDSPQCVSYHDGTTRFPCRIRCRNLREKREIRFGATRTVGAMCLWQDSGALSGDISGRKDLYDR